ncbi:universal stress protein [uncultured Tateyamaria sp.]|uniref:universal stress protein n=1 Tax=uncultured Tateyamaria sp. TaxID=455651 RepID=UPI0026342288|nr:universal stress protein [uncultured Tateyamaria sp.]
MTTLTSVLVATDLSARSDRAVRRAAQIARDHGARLRVMTVLDDAMPADLIAMVHDRTQSTIAHFVASACDGVDVTVDVQPGDPTTAIVQACTADVDLLVMGTHRARAILDAIRETTMQRIARLTATPVLLVTDRADHPYAKVVAACDFSPASSAALRLAHLIAPAAHITPVHTLHIPYAGRLSHSTAAADAIEASFRHEAESAARTWLERETLPTQHMADLEIIPGSPMQILHGKVDHAGVDLITVGAHGRVGAARSLLGSLATDLMRDPPCDVLIARP